MRKSRYSEIGVAACVSLFAIICATPAHADGFADFVKKLRPYAQVGLTDDSNIFRLPSPQDLSDQYVTYEAGIDALFESGNQKFQLSGLAFQNDYDEFSSIDFNGGHALALWSWSGRNRLSGELGYEFDRNRRDFANQTIPQHDLRTTKKIRGKIGFGLSKQIKLTFRGDAADVSFSDGLSLEQERVTGGVAIEYFTRIGNSIGIDAEYIDGEFDNNPLNDYKQSDIGPTFNWKASTKTTLTGKAGYLRRTHDNSPEQDFDGATARLTLSWRASKGSKIEASAWRELSNLGDEISDYAVVDGISLEPTLQMGSRMAIRVILSYEERDFREQAGPIPLESRKDKVSTGGVLLEWKAMSALSFTFGFTAEDRSSNRIFADYDYQAVEGHIRFGF